MSERNGKAVVACGGIMQLEACDVRSRGMEIARRAFVDYAETFEALAR